MTRGCHSCSVDLSKYNSYEESPCATCFLTKEYNHTHNHGLFDNINTADPDADPAVIAQASSGVSNEQEELLSSVTADLEILTAMKSVCEAQVMNVVSNVCLRLIKMIKRNPVTVGILLKKWQFPHMSYSDIGASMNPRCSKQNVLYHLKQAVQQFPELEALILTDTRFSGGRYALRTVASQCRKDYIEDRLREALYGKDILKKQETLEQISRLLDAHCALPDDIIDFDPYTEVDNGHSAC